MSRLQMRHHLTRKFGRLGFSIVEVVLALGVVSFCLLALIGLLPIGLNAVNDAGNSSAGINVLEQLSSSIRHGSKTSGGVFNALPPYSDLSWTLAGPQLPPKEYNNLSWGGIQTDVVADQKIKARIVLTPPTSETAPGRASITVAWPQSAVWDSVNGSWKNASGFASTSLIFLPAE